jgi:membrane protein YqaA with SNARE-associated domain
MELLNTTWEVAIVASLLGGTLGYLFAEWRLRRNKNG